MLEQLTACVRPAAVVGILVLGNEKHPKKSGRGVDMGVFGALGAPFVVLGWWEAWSSTMEGLNY